MLDPQRQKVIYDDRLAEIYAQGRELTSERLSAWLAAFAQHVGGGRPLVCADVGSGTGRFTPGLADAFGGPVFGVEPSAAMRSVAERIFRHPRVRYLNGTAESIPLLDSGCDFALLYFVWHHVLDKPKAAAELARIVRPGGTLLVRTNFSDRMPDLWWYGAFPRARHVDAAMYDTLANTTSIFAGNGWKLTRLMRVETVESTTYAENFAQLRKRALSTFQHLTEDEIEEGFASIAKHLRGRECAGPVLSSADLLALKRANPRAVRPPRDICGPE